jgi:hypothetical protein
VFSNTHMCAGLYTPAAPRQPDWTMSRRRNGKTYRPPDNIRAAGSVPKEIRLVHVARQRPEAEAHRRGLSDDSVRDGVETSLYRDCCGGVCPTRPQGLIASAARRFRLATPLIALTAHVEAHIHDVKPTELERPTGRSPPAPSA